MFTTTALQNSLDFILPIIKAKNAGADLVSNEIKLLEKTLQEAGLSTPIKAKYLGTCRTPKDSKVNYTVHYLLWDHYQAEGQKAAGKMRLLHQANYEAFEPEEGDVDSQHIWAIYDGRILIESDPKPLIEAPLLVRERAHQDGLLAFLDQVCWAQGVNPYE